MYDVITIGSSLIDTFIKSKQFGNKQVGGDINVCFVYGAKLDIDSYLIKTGGGGSNTAVGFARLGFRTAIVTEIGGDILASVILSELRKEVVATNLVIQEPTEVTGGSVILLDEDGKRTVMVHRGASSMLDVADIPREKIMRAEWLHLSSIAGRLDTLKYLFSLRKKSNNWMSWNPGSKELALIKDDKLDLHQLPVKIFIVNLEEWQAIKNQQAQILENIEQVIVTNGSRGGSVYLNSKLELEFNSQTAEVVDNTGAGDAFSVGYISAYLKKKKLQTRVDWGKQNAQAVVRQMGAKTGLLTNFRS